MGYFEDNEFALFVRASRDKTRRTEGACISGNVTLVSKRRLKQS